ncbi:hypothetical protein [Carboxylicivirga linearis]|uniref:Uncharacterized protein n=1 Tax=Carboxylicivirga linearis TaxID=1628157 RepID=A0ABS5K258_9BACT|nr:hypothetical protein [Carboxylicivirga linearis]MBS2101219.1 hypothetical protein [Carboxylicivirga linearis]
MFFELVRKKEKDLVIVGLIVLFFSIGAIVQSSIEESNKSFIKKDFSITIGTFSDFNLVGAENNPYLTYKYTVNKKDYFRTIMPNRNPYYCEKNNCQGLMWVVVYSNSKPKKSLINLSHRLYSTSSLIEISDLDEFE